jgi:hypothetical protein
MGATSMKKLIIAAFAVMSMGLSVGNTAPVGNYSTTWSNGTNFVAGGGG